MIARLILRAYRQVCGRCRGVMWPWQDRCNGYHARCQHAAMVASHARQLGMGFDVPMWSCDWCGEVPS